MEWNYHFEGEDEVLSPALVYYKEILAENIRRAVLEAGGAERLWPHVKTHKSLDLLRMLGALESSGLNARLWRRRRWQLKPVPDIFCWHILWWGRI